MEKSDYILDNFYSKGPSDFVPGEDIPSIGYEIKSGEMGMTTDPRSANQLAALGTALNSGVIPIEVGVLQPETFDQIPQQHFTEMRRKAKLADSKISMHAPLVDPTGMTQQGWDENQQIAAEKQLIDVMDKAALLDDKNNVPVTIHSSNYAGSTYKFEDGEKVAEQIVTIDKATGQMRPIKKDEKFIPGLARDKKTGDFSYVSKDIRSPEEQVEIANNSAWQDEIDKAIFQKASADNILSKLTEETRRLAAETNKNDALFDKLSSNEKSSVLQVSSAKSYLDDANRTLNASFTKAYEHGTEDQRKKLIKLSKEYTRDLYGIDPNKITSGKLTKDEDLLMKHHSSDIKNQANAMQIFANKLKEVNPNTIVRIEDFAIEKAADTLSKVALHTYENYEKKGKAAPILSIEHLPAGMAFSQAGDLKDLIENTQKKFAKKLIDDGSLSKDKANKMAHKLIGATFDVGHMNINKKHGFTDKDIAAEAKEIAKHVKHVHLTDNFGYSDSHLPIGMGNVPVKEIMEALGEEGAKARKINEVGGWFEHFKTNPFAQILEASGSPIYSSGEGPYWSQRTGFQQNYFGGYGTLLPSTNYETFGAGFSRLPQELGGSNQQGTGGRMGGARE